MELEREQEKLNKMLNKVQEVQLLLGNKRFFFDDGSMMDLEEYENYRNKLKRENIKLVTEYKIQKNIVKNLFRKQRNPQVPSKPVSFNKVISKAFGIICDDLSKIEEFPNTPKEVAELYKNRAIISIFEDQNCLTDRTS